MQHSFHNAFYAFQEKRERVQLCNFPIVDKQLPEPEGFFLERLGRRSQNLPMPRVNSVSRGYRGRRDEFSGFTDAYVTSLLHQQPGPLDMGTNKVAIAASGCP